MDLNLRLTATVVSVNKEYLYRPTHPGRSPIPEEYVSSNAQGAAVAP